jgi:DNA-binding response OmpR family regulator
MLRQRPPSVVVLDLPYAESSGDLCRKIANLVPGLPLVILSASPDVAHQVLLLEMGADDHVTIPFSPRALVDRLRMLMRSRSHVSPESLHVFESGTAGFSNLIRESNPSEGAES